MKERLSGYARTTITVPHNLKRRMQRVPAVNWSAVACQAFEMKLAELTKQQGEQAMSDTPSMDDAIERLRRLKNLPDRAKKPRDFEEGFQWGRHWAMAKATPLELRRLETFSQEVGQQWSLLDIHGGKDMMKKIALAVTAAELPPRQEVRRGHIPPELKEFWRVKIGLPGQPDDCLSFARGFCEGAMRFWNEAKDKI
jgi:hypothetical protein